MNLANLQQAVYTRLAGYTALTSQLAGQGVYSRVPQPDAAESTAPFPYITFDFVSFVPFDTDDNDGIQAVLRVHTWSRSQSVLQMSAIMDSIYDCLHKFQIVISGASTVDCLFITGQTMDDPDGVTTHGVSEFRITYDDI